MPTYLQVALGVVIGGVALILLWRTSFGWALLFGTIWAGQIAIGIAVVALLVAFAAAQFEVPIADGAIVVAAVVALVLIGLAFVLGAWAGLVGWKTRQERRRSLRAELRELRRMRKRTPDSPRP